MKQDRHLTGSSGFRQEELRGKACWWTSSL